MKSYVPCRRSGGDNGRLLGRTAPQSPPIATQPIASKSRVGCGCIPDSPSGRPVVPAFRILTSCTCSINLPSSQPPHVTVGWLCECGTCLCYPNTIVVGCIAIVSMAPVKSEVLDIVTSLLSQAQLQPATVRSRECASNAHDCAEVVQRGTVRAGQQLQIDQSELFTVIMHREQKRWSSFDMSHWLKNTNLF